MLTLSWKVFFAYFLIAANAQPGLINWSCFNSEWIHLTVELLLFIVVHTYWIVLKGYLLSFHPWVVWYWLRIEWRHIDGRDVEDRMNWIILQSHPWSNRNNCRRSFWTPTKILKKIIAQLTGSYGRQQSVQPCGASDDNPHGIPSNDSSRTTDK